MGKEEEENVTEANWERFLGLYMDAPNKDNCPKEEEKKQISPNSHKVETVVKEFNKKNHKS